MAAKKKVSKSARSVVSPTLHALRGVTLGLMEEHLKSGAESAGAFARRAGIAATTMSDLRSGYRELGIESLLAVRTGLGLDLGDVEIATNQWIRGVRPASACFGAKSLDKVAIVAKRYALGVEAAKAAAPAPQS